MALNEKKKNSLLYFCAQVVISPWDRRIYNTIRFSTLVDLFIYSEEYRKSQVLVFPSFSGNGDLGEEKEVQGASLMDVKVLLFVADVDFFKEELSYKDHRFYVRLHLSFLQRLMILVYKVSQNFVVDPLRHCPNDE